MSSKRSRDFCISVRRRFRLENLLPPSHLFHHFRFTFPVRRHPDLRSRYSSGTILLLYIYSVPGIPWPPAAQALQSFLFPRYFPPFYPRKNGIDYSTPFQQRTGKNCRLQQRLTRSAPCLFFRTGRRLDQVAVRILILIYDDIRCSIRSRSCYRQFF